MGNQPKRLNDEINRQVDLVRSALSPLPYVELAILFGSLAKGSQRAHSDLDVAVLAKERLTAAQRIELIDSMAIASGRPVDLIDLRSAGQPILNQILAYGIRVIGTNAEMASLVYRNLFDRANFLPRQERIINDDIATDLEVITQKLVSLQRCIERIRVTCPDNVDELMIDIDAQDILTLNLSRAVQLAVDVSSHILVSSRQAAPDTMGASFDGMRHLGILDEDLSLHLKKAVGFRNIAVHNYEAINWAVVFSIVAERLDDFVKFAHAVSDWLTKQPSTR